MTANKVMDIKNAWSAYVQHQAFNFLTNSRFNHQQENLLYRFPALLNADGVNSLAGKFALKLYGLCSFVKPIAR